jgi:hypothetical protein
MKNETLEVPRLAPRRRVPSDWVRTTTSGTFAKLVLEGGQSRLSSCHTVAHTAGLWSRSSSRWQRC